MNDTPDVPEATRSIWLRALLMVLMACIYQISGTVLFFVAIFQFLMVLLTEKPNDRLLALGRSLGNYLRQITHFLTFATEDVPFPFREWPSGD